MSRRCGWAEIDGQEVFVHFFPVPGDVMVCQCGDRVEQRRRRSKFGDCDTRCYGLSEIGGYLHVSDTTVQKRIVADKTFPARKEGRMWVADKPALRKWMKANNWRRPECEHGGQCEKHRKEVEK